MVYGVARISCKCNNEFQDKRYGIGVRIANTTKKQDKDFCEVRCTVCSALQRITPSKVK